MNIHSRGLFFGLVFGIIFSTIKKYKNDKKPLKAVHIKNKNDFGKIIFYVYGKMTEGKGVKRRGCGKSA